MANAIPSLPAVCCSLSTATGTRSKTRAANCCARSTSTYRPPTARTATNCRPRRPDTQWRSLIQIPSSVRALQPCTAESCRRATHRHRRLEHSARHRCRISGVRHAPRALRFERYARWAGLTPDAFRFAVKLPRSITHEGRLRHARAPLYSFLDEVAGLGETLGPLLVQLPPSLAFEARVARAFFALLRKRHAGPVVCEPRHASWFGAAAEEVLSRFHFGRVAADPACVSAAARPGGWLGETRDGAGATVYYRLHGSPRMFL